MWKGNESLKWNDDKKKQGIREKVKGKDREKKKSMQMRVVNRQ